ncbi:SRPBCC domain-containing protein [Pseudoruegeria sp. HB172150]|uniref:SRPBCC family protein n=1 Tax=Pseudoruegeria sp. HB172150 TaxID=2721164 RepID=UPI0015555314|nr:SRPBCC domain-containing protein [Pseudoruegeria sp. HB172150]
MTTDLSLRVTQSVPAKPERVFDAWLDPEMIRRFMLTGPGTGVKSATNDPRVGGRYDIVMTNDMGEIPHWGEYREIDRPNRLIFTWNSPHAAPDSLVTLTFEPEGAGTLVTLFHEKFPSEGSRDGHEKGWTGILGTLADVLGTTA